MRSRPRPSAKIYLGFSVLNENVDRGRRAHSDARLFRFSSFFSFLLKVSLEVVGNFFKMARKMTRFRKSKSAREFFIRSSWFPDVPPSTAAETSMLRNIAVERRRRRREGMKEKISTAAWKWYSRQTGGRNNFQRFCEIPRNIKFRIFIRRKSWLCYYAVSRNRY